jgi:hypothetical protein
LDGLASLTLVPITASQQNGLKLNSQNARFTTKTVNGKRQNHCSISKSFFAHQEKRPGMANPENTKSLDQILKQKSINFNTHK